MADEKEVKGSAEKEIKKSEIETNKITMDFDLEFAQSNDEKKKTKPRFMAVPYTLYPEMRQAYDRKVKRQQPVLDIFERQFREIKRELTILDLESDIASHKREYLANLVEEFSGQFLFDLPPQTKANSLRRRHFKP
jgi:hypothetical protein